MLYVLYVVKAPYGRFRCVWGRCFCFRKIFIAMLVLQEDWFSVWNLSGATGAGQEFYKVDDYLVRIL